MPNNNTPVAKARLNITGLPSLTDCMLVGGMYVLIAETPPTRFPILASSLASALAQELSCTVILREQAEIFLERIESFGDLDTSTQLADSNLHVFLLQESFTQKMFRFGAGNFCKELAQFDTPHNSFMIFDHADELFSLHDISLAMEQVDIFKRWFGERGITVLLTFSRLTDAATDTLLTMMDKLAGIVHISSDKSGLALTFDYWQSPEGTIAAKHYPLTTAQSGLYRVDTKPTDTHVELEQDEGKPRFFYMDKELSNLHQQLSGDWQYVDSLVGMMHATRGLRSATVILSFQKDISLRQLAETVHTLRLNLGKRACIVVHENSSSLRYQNEALLLHLGVNLVIHKGVVASRLPLLISSVIGQSFNRNVDVNFEVALSSAIPSSLRGYQTPTRFVREVGTIIERSEILNVPCALVIGVPARDTSVEDVISRVDMSRSGDLSSSDGTECYFFLSGCPESVLLVTIERLLGKSVDVAFEQCRFIIKQHEIQAELNVLTRAGNRGDLPDYSGVSNVPLTTTETLDAPYNAKQNLSIVPSETRTPSTLNSQTLQQEMAHPARLNTPNTTHFATEVKSNPSAPLAHSSTIGVHASAESFAKQASPRATRAIQKQSA